MARLPLIFAALILAPCARADAATGEYVTGRTPALGPAGARYVSSKDNEGGKVSLDPAHGNPAPSVRLSSDEKEVVAVTEDGETPSARVPSAGKDKKPTILITVEAAVPLAALGIAPQPGQPLRGDFGVTFGDPAGRRTRLRSFWSNQHTGIVDDAVFELMLEPGNWGELLGRIDVRALIRELME